MLEDYKQAARGGFAAGSDPDNNDHPVLNALAVGSAYVVMAPFLAVRYVKDALLALALSRIFPNGF